MNGIRVVTLAGILLILAAPCTVAQVQEFSPIQLANTPQGEAPAGTPTVPDRLRYNEAAVHMLNGQNYTGFYGGLLNDSILLVSRGQDVRIALGDMKELTIETALDRGSFALSGMLAGMYLGVALTGKGSGPSGYAKEPPPLGGLLLGIPGLVLFGSFRFPGSQTFVFSGNPEDDATELSELKEFLQGGPGRSRIHFTMSGGWVTTRGSSKPAGLYSGVPFSTPWVLPEQMPSIETPTLNLLRRFQLTYSILPWLEAGVAYVNVSEPSVVGYARTSLIDSVAVFSGYSEWYTASANLAVGVVEPLRTLLPRALSFKAGAGIGFGKVDARTDHTQHTVKRFRQTYYPGHTYEYWREQSVTSSPQTLSEMRMAFSLFGSVDLRLGQMATVGLSVDYTSLLGDGLPAVPEWNWKSRPFANACVGVTIGCHF